MLQRLGSCANWISPWLLVLALAGCSSKPAEPEAIAPVPVASSLHSKTANPASSGQRLTQKPTAVPQRVAQVSPTTEVTPPVPNFRSQQRMAGFSEDGRFYLYLESSRDTGAGIPKSRLQVIDIAANRCVSDGCLETNYGEGDADRTLEEAENSLLQKTSAIRQTLQITSPKLGSSVVMEGQSRLADGTETVTLRMNNRTIPVQLKQQRQRSVSFGGTAERDQAAMQLEVQVANQKKMVDSLENYREWVLDYSIRDAYLSPDGKYVVLLITATKPTFEGTLATTLVQGFEL